jgi:hypothetical protein
VERQGPEVAAAVQQISAGGGLAVLAHPIRLGVRDVAAEDALIGQLREAGVSGLEVYHSDHGPADIARYGRIAKKYGLAVTGGSDFHGDAKPEVALGTGRNGSLNIPKSVLDTLRQR